MREKRPTVKDWILATRPWSFAVSALPAFVALMYTIHAHPEHSEHWFYGALAVIGAVIFHAGGNLISDYHDFRNGIDREDNVGADTLTSRLFLPKQVLTYGWAFIAIGTALGVFLLLQTGTALIWAGLFGAVGAVFYYYFKTNALGDFLIFLVYGPTIMLGTGYVMLGYYDWTLLFVSFPIAFITVNVLHSNNTRDIQSDRYAGIKTFAMLIGTKASVYHYYGLTILSYVFIVGMILVGILPATTIIALLTIPIAVRNCKIMSQISENDATPINSLDKNTAQLQLLFSASMLLALTISIAL